MDLEIEIARKKERKAEKVSHVDWEREKEKGIQIEKESK